MSDIKETPEERQALKEAMLQYAKEEFPHFKRVEALTRPAPLQTSKEMENGKIEPIVIGFIDRAGKVSKEQFMMPYNIPYNMVDSNFVMYQDGERIELKLNDISAFEKNLNTGRLKAYVMSVSKKFQEIPSEFMLSTDNITGEKAIAIKLDKKGIDRNDIFFVFAYVELYFRQHITILCDL